MKLVTAALALTLVLAAQAAAAGGGSLVELRSTSLGHVLVDARGHTLYLFAADRGRTSRCYGACARFWPPLLTASRPRAAAGARAALLGTTRRTDGKLQVTYAGHPLYTFARDIAAGQTKGEGLNVSGGRWYAVSAVGRKVVETAATSSAGGTTTTPYTPPTYTTTDPAPGY